MSRASLPPCQIMPLKPKQALTGPRDAFSALLYSYEQPSLFMLDDYGVMAYPDMGVEKPPASLQPPVASHATGGQKAHYYQRSLFDKSV